MPSVTVTLATVGDVDPPATVTPSVPTTPLLDLALTVAFPAATAVSLPRELTCNTVGLDDAQVNAVFTTFPDPSYAVPVACAALPTVRLVGALTLTDATTGLPLPTIRLADALFPSDDAVMTVVPADTPVITPDVATDATVGCELENAIDRPVRRLPEASYSFTTASLVSPPPMLSRVS